MGADWVYVIPAAIIVSFAAGYILGSVTNSND